VEVRVLAGHGPVAAIEGHGVVAANTAIVLVEGDKLLIRVAASEDEAHLGMHVPAPAEDRPHDQ
jgi:hypothetical protein